MLAEQIRIEEVITANGGIGSGLPLDDWQDLPLRGSISWLNVLLRPFMWLYHPKPK